MNIIVSLLFILFFLIIILKINKKRENFNNKKGTLFLYTEAGGFDVDDFKNFPDIELIKEKFDKIAIVAPNFQPSKIQKTIDIWENKTIKNIGLPIERWLNIYFGRDGFFCSLNNKGCYKEDDCYSGCPIGQCIESEQNSKYQLTECLLKPYLDNKSIKLKGIVFDDEVGINDKIVKELENLKDKYPDIKLAWSSAMTTAKNGCPTKSRDYKCDPNKWAYSLGQIYTADDGKLNEDEGDVPKFYTEDCGWSDNFWINVGKDLKYGKIDEVDKNLGVPMVCGAGDCQLTKHDNSIRWDERRTGVQITELLKKRDDDFPWRNFGIWYGKYNPNNPDNKKPIYKSCL